LEPLKVKIINFPLPATTKHTQVTVFPSDLQQGFNFVPIGVGTEYWTLWL